MSHKMQKLDKHSKVYTREKQEKNRKFNSKIVVEQSNRNNFQFSKTNVSQVFYLHLYLPLRSVKKIALIKFNLLDE